MGGMPWKPGCSHTQYPAVPPESRENGNQKMGFKDQTRTVPTQIVLIPEVSTSLQPRPGTWARRTRATNQGSQNFKMRTRSEKRASIGAGSPLLLEELRELARVREDLLLEIILVRGVPPPALRAGDRLLVVDVPRVDRERCPAAEALHRELGDPHDSRLAARSSRALISRARVGPMSRTRRSSTSVAAKTRRAVPNRSISFAARAFPIPGNPSRRNRRRSSGLMAFRLCRTP